MLTLSILMAHAYLMSFYVIYITTYFTKQVLRRHTSETNKKKPIDRGSGVVVKRSPRMRDIGEPSLLNDHERRAKVYICSTSSVW